MQNSPIIIPSPPPLLLPPPPHSTDQIPIFPTQSLPPSPFVGSPNSVFQINVLPAPPLPPPSPFAGVHSSVDLSPLEFILALIAFVTIPALIYSFIFAFCSPSSRRRRQSSVELSVDPSITSELSHHEVENSGAGEFTDENYHKEANVKKIGGECPVCLSVFADGEEVRQLSACKHSFHASCIDMWLSNHSNCPICRATIAAAVKRSGSNSSAAPNTDSDRQQVASALV
ncbi:hypothetical protein TanjilG_08476 [Lupinus angustifolius]|uniref:RING-type domain-containing protein n=2 Tax=Lupinus angustifolius TaxID=3871 RepID=A0A1J7I0K8_LUPAN|nr:hypothetical protein TanjilG_08476 [Lupinus angustifolius]